MSGALAAAPNRFGKYSLVAKLAMGGMAEILLARLEGAAGFAKLVCIKRMLPQLAREPGLVEMFLAEAKIAAQITHHNVCHVFELGEIDGRYFIAMEYLTGVPISCFRRADLYRTAPDPQLVAGLAIQACEGLHHAHNLKRPDGSAMGVVHRDVSANNLFATTDGVVKVLDFGIAKITDASIKTSTGSVKGTYAYMAPEQLRGDRVDRRADVFAIGIVLWETLARRHLFKRDTDYLTFEAIMHEPIPDVAELRPDVPPALADAIATALARDRDKRFASARALADAITKAVAPLGGPLPPAAIADEIARAFEPRLQQQRELLQLAHDGRALDLEVDVGPGVGHGTEMLTTPISIITGQSGSAAPRPSTLSQLIAELPAAEPASAPPVAPPRAPRSATMPVQLSSGRRHWLVVVAAGMLAGAVAGGVALWRLHDDDAPAAATPANAIVMQASPPAVSPPAVSPPAVSPPPSPPPSPPTVSPSPSPSPSPPVARIAPRPPSHPSSPTPAAPSPPAPPATPGFVTIDSAPVYATITIDGKGYGETPLIHISLAPGKHYVRATSPSGAIHNVVVTIESGKVAPAARIEW